MPSLCLSRSEIAELTRTPMRKRQVAFLRTNGIAHYIDSHGWPVVLRAAVEPGRGSADDGPPVWKPRKAA